MTEMSPVVSNTTARTSVKLVTPAALSFSNTFARKTRVLVNADSRNWPRSISKVGSFVKAVVTVLHFCRAFAKTH